MINSVRVRVASVLERVGLPEKLNDIAYIVARHICRLVGANQYRREIKVQLQNYVDLQEEFITLKDDLDHSIKKNNLFRAIHRLSRYPYVSRAHVVESANLFHVDHEDVGFFYNLLPQTDLDLLCAKELPDHIYSDKEILEIFSQLERHIMSLAYRKLGFILQHDPAVDSVRDLVSLLQLGALKALREYEVQAITSEHLTALTARSIKNHAINTAASSGRQKRRKVDRVRQSRALRHAFHLDVEEGRIREVQLIPDQEYRIKQDGNILIGVLCVETGDWFVAHMKRIYATLNEATEAYNRHLNGERSKRTIFIDPSPQQIDDFQANVVSIDHMDAGLEGEGVFYSTYADEFAVAADSSVKEQEFRAHLGPKASKFADYIFDSAIDDLFAEWCRQNGYDASTCSYAQMGRLVCKYTGVTKLDIQRELLDTPAHLWESSDIRFLEDHHSN